MLPKFYYINLDRSEDRLVHMEKFFKKIKKKLELEARFQRISGFDGKKEIVDNFSNIRLKDMWLNKQQGRKAIGPEFGCCYSHIKSMKAFIEDADNKDDVAFICEDDLELFKIEKDYFIKMIGEAIDKTNNCDLTAVSCVGSPLVIGPISDKCNSPIFLDYQSYRGKLYGTGCYLISRKLATDLVGKFWKDDKLIIDPNHESMVADHFIYPQCKETTFMIPSLFTLRKQNDSYIHSEHLKMHDEVQVMMFKMWAKFNIAKVKKIAIVSNNDWGIEYYESKRIDFNSPTIGTSMTHADYIKFLERFDEYIDKTPEKVESEEKYPVGKISLDNESILIHFVKENKWDVALSKWQKRKLLLPKKSDILFKICDRKFNGELTVDILERFLKLKNKKIVFLSEFFDNKEKYKDDVKIIPSKFCDNLNKCCPKGDKLFKICGIN